MTIPEGLIGPATTWITGKAQVWYEGVSRSESGDCLDPARQPWWIPGKKCFSRRRGLARDLHHISFRYSCTNWTAIAPSPTADATRLTEPERTSPAANTPGRLVSSRNGGRFAPQVGDWARAGPVRTNPFESISISFGQPVGPRHGTDEAEERRSLQHLRLTCLAVDNLYRGQTEIAGHPLDLRVEQHLDVAGLLEPPGQVARHTLVQIVAADQDEHLPRLTGEEDGGLSGGVAATDDYHVRAPAHLRLVGCRGVIDAAALESLAPLDTETAILRAGGDQKALGNDGFATVQVKNGVGVVERQTGHRPGDRQAGTKLVGLEDCAIR